MDAVAKAYFSAFRKEVLGSRAEAAVTLSRLKGTRFDVKVDSTYEAFLLRMETT